MQQPLNNENNSAKIPKNADDSSLMMDNSLLKFEEEQDSSYS
jgi:hypothetical protein